MAKNGAKLRPCGHGLKGHICEEGRCDEFTYIGEGMFVCMYDTPITVVEDWVPVWDDGWVASDE